MNVRYENVTVAAQKQTRPDPLPTTPEKSGYTLEECIAYTDSALSNTSIGEAMKHYLTEYWKIRGKAIKNEADTPDKEAS